MVVEFLRWLKSEVRQEEYSVTGIHASQIQISGIMKTDSFPLPHYFKVKNITQEVILLSSILRD